MVALNYDVTMEDIDDEDWETSTEKVKSMQKSGDFFTRI